MAGTRQPYTSECKNYLVWGLSLKLCYEPLLEAGYQAGWTIGLNQFGSFYVLI